jgi:hypothetical protein
MFDNEVLVLFNHPFRCAQHLSRHRRASTLMPSLAQRVQDVLYSHCHG